VHRIPIEVPPGIGVLVPEIALAYSSQGGVGAAGVGWDLPMAMITLSHADGTRPPCFRYRPGPAGPGALPPAGPEAHGSRGRVSRSLGATGVAMILDPRR
jgi:hypothetical protein